MDLLSVGKAGLQGWRAKVAHGVATPVARRSALTEEQVQAAVGAVFLVLAVVYVIGAVRRLARGG